MLIKVLGSAAGGGLPQWNCNGPNSAAVRRGDVGLSPRTQCSLAVSADGVRWVLLNAAPDLRQQIMQTAELQPNPSGPLRDSPIHAVILTNAEVDSLAGLLTLRERQALTIYATPSVLELLAANPIFDALDRTIVDRVPLPIDRSVQLTARGHELGIAVEPFAVPGKLPLYLEHGADVVPVGGRSGDAIGLRLTDGKDSLAFVPGCAEIDADLKRNLDGADTLLFDGTLFTDDELVRQGLSAKTGKRMGHVSISGGDGSLKQLADLRVGRRIYVHINNSNPILHERSPERRHVEAAGWDVAFDGMTIGP